MSVDTHDLFKLADTLATKFPEIQTLYLFGSRRYRTRSVRSDIDLIVRTSGYVQASELRNFALKLCPALDLFLLNGNRAVSCANDSFVEAGSAEAVIAKVEAVEFWNRLSGANSSADIDREVHVLRGQTFVPSTMRGPGPYAGWNPSIEELFYRLDEEGIPTRPFIGTDVREIGDWLVATCRRAIAVSLSSKFRGKGLKVSISDEYDFQDLFQLVTKPWLPSLERENLAVIYDGQKKNADFGLAQSRIVIELKFISDSNTKAAVAKTLCGLADFYKANANVRLLLFGVAVAPDVDLDHDKWEQDFSHRGDVAVRTFVIKLPKK